MTIDGDQTEPPVSSYEFNKPGNDKLYFNLKNDINVNDLSNLFQNNAELNPVVFSEDFDSTM